MLTGIETFERRTQMLEMFNGDQLVQSIRESGYATCHRNPHTACPGKTSSIGVPVFECDRVVRTLTLVFFATSMRMAEAVKRCAAALKAVGSALSDGLTHGKRGAEVNERLPSVAALPPRASRSASVSASAFATAH